MDRDFFIDSFKRGFRHFKMFSSIFSNPDVFKAIAEGRGDKVEGDGTPKGYESRLITIHTKGQEDAALGLFITFRINQDNILKMVCGPIGNKDYRFEYKEPVTENNIDEVCGILYETSLEMFKGLHVNYEGICVLGDDNTYYDTKDYDENHDACEYGEEA